MDAEALAALEHSSQRARTFIAEADAERRHTNQPPWEFCKHWARAAFREYPAPRLRKLTRAERRRHDRLVYLAACAQVPPPPDPQPWSDEPGWTLDSAASWSISWRQAYPGYGLQPADDEISPIRLPVPLPTLINRCRLPKPL
ncbi:hypothetical protein B0H11DRAFT_2232286 [Mycena galericulata]|nr:hypothetical protein B0H11DRAFT_2232286 [Mycena galericulata]